MYISGADITSELTHYKLAKMSLRHHEATKLRRFSPMKVVCLLYESCFPLPSKDACLCPQKCCGNRFLLYWSYWWWMFTLIMRPEFFSFQSLFFFLVPSFPHCLQDCLHNVIYQFVNLELNWLITFKFYLFWSIPLKARYIIIGK